MCIELERFIKGLRSLVRPTRSQYKLMWALLTDIANQAKWNGWQLSKEEWKELFTTYLFGRQKLSTRDFTVEQMSDLICFIEVFAIDNNILLRNM